MVASKEDLIKYNEKKNKAREYHKKMCSMRTNYSNDNAINFFFNLKSTVGRLKE